MVFFFFDKRWLILKRRGYPFIAWYYPILGGVALFLFVYLIKKDIGTAINFGLGTFIGFFVVFLIAKYLQK